MSVIKEEYLLVRFSRLLRDTDPYPTTNVVIDETVATFLTDYSAYVARIKLGLAFGSSDVQTDYNIIQ